MARAGRVPGPPMSRITARTQDAQGQPLFLAAGFDPGTGVHFLDVFAGHDDEDLPIYDSMFAHPRGLIAYNLEDLAADLTRHVGRPLDALVEAVRTTPTDTSPRHLGHL